MPETESNPDDSNEAAGAESDKKSIDEEEIAERIERGVIDTAVKELLSALSTDKKRVRFFTSVHKKPSWDDLKEEFPQNAHRYRNQLEELGLMMLRGNENGSDICCLTPLGESVWEGFVQVAAQSSAVHNLNDFFYATDWHPTIRENWDIFKGSEVLVDNQRIKKVEGTYEGFVQALREFKELTRVLRSAGDFDNRVNSGLQSEIIYPSQLAQDIRHDDMYLQMAKEHERANTEYYVSDDLPPYQLSLMEIDADELNTNSRAYQVLTRLSDSDDVATRFVSIWAWMNDTNNVLLISNNDEVWTWAEQMFEKKRDAADRLKFRQGP